MNPFLAWLQFKKIRNLGLLFVFLQHVHKVSNQTFPKFEAFVLCATNIINDEDAVNCFYGWQISILINFKKIFEHFLNNNNNDNIITSRDAQCFWCSLFNAFSDLTVAHLPIVGCHKIIDVYNFIIWKRPCIRWRQTNKRQHTKIWRHSFRLQNHNKYSTIFRSS